MNYKKLAILIFSLFVIICLLVVKNSNKYSIVRVISKKGLLIKEGYGIVYKTNHSTYIVTNYHIVNNGKDIQIKYANKNIKAYLINGDEYEDIAVIRVDNTKDFKPAMFNMNYYTNDHVWMNGYHKKHFGIVIQKNEKVLVNLTSGNYIINASKLFLPIENGDSGKAVYKNNKIIGMITMQCNNNKKISYAMDIKQVLIIAHKLEKNHIKRRDLNVKLASTKNSEIINRYNLKNNGLRGVIVVNSYNSKILKTGDIITKINNVEIEDIAHFKYYLYNFNNIKLTIYHNGKYRTEYIENSF